MPTDTIPIDLLGAVNELLRAVGRAEVSSLLTADMNQYAQQALSVINSTSVEVQARDWHFNSETDYPLEPNADSEIVLPANTGAVRVSERSIYMDVTQRRQRLYDRKAHTFKFTAPVFVDIRFLLDFADLPQPIRWYVTALSGRKYAVGRVPDSSTFKFTQAVEADALSAAEQFDAWATNRTAPETSSHFAMMRRR